jgi:hypothetical protein
MFITAFTTARQRSLTWARWIHSTDSQPISLRSMLIPSSHLRLGLTSGRFHSGFPTKSLYTFLPPSHACHMPCPPHSPWFGLPINIWWWVQIMKLPIVQLSPFSRYFIPLRSHVHFSVLLSFCQWTCPGPRLFRTLRMCKASTISMVLFD